MLNHDACAPHPCIQIFNPNTLYNPEPFAYSHIAAVRNIRRIVHIAGQGGENQQGLLCNDFTQQLQQAFANLQLALQAADAALPDIAALRILIAGHSPEKHQMLIQHMRHLWKNSAFPACTLIPVPCLALAGMQIEIEAMAYCA